ncbi:MAG: L,D-transpeptidase family protein [Candidatus Yanofskybacteria bacterium]|nr:L,D-transpeptidase family protein [Candidatus Yanofskybacteria bacterium]
MKQQEWPVAPERSREELYADTLRLKRDVLLSKTEMDSIRREINKRIDNMDESKLKTDPQVVEYERIGREYDRKRKLFLGSFEKLSDEDKEKTNQTTSLSKIEAELSSGQQTKDKKKRLRFGIETPETEKEATLDEIEKMLQYAKDTARPLESAYWEDKRREFQERRKERKDTINAEIDRMIDYSIDTGKPLELAYWEAKAAIKKTEDVPDRIKEIDSQLLEKYKILRQEAGVINRRPLEEEIEALEKEKARLGKSRKTGAKESVETELKPETEPKTEPKSKPEIAQRSKQEFVPVITIEQKDEIDRLFLEGVEEESSELSVPVQKIEVVEEDRATIDDAIDQAVLTLGTSLEAGETVTEEVASEIKEVPKETPSESEIKTIIPKTEKVVPEDIIPEIKIPERKTFLQKIRDRVRKKALIYVGAGLLTLGAWKGEVYEDLPKAPDMIANILDRVPDIDVPTELPTMMAKEAARYSVKPYLAARYVGSDDYFQLEAIKAADVLGLEDKAEKMYEESLSDYINNFSEIRRNNRFTTLDKHTVRNYMDAFVQLYSGQEQTGSALETYQKFSNFLEANFGAAKAYEFALKITSEEDLSPKLADLSKKDLKKWELILRKAAGKSSIYFNQEEGIFNVVHNGHLIDTYASRAGFMNVPKDGGPAFKSLGYGRTPDGIFTISSVEYGYSTLRWKDSFLPYGAEIRLGGSGEVEYKYHDKWYPATGPEATYFDQGNKIQPNKSEEHLRHLKERSRGESPLAKLDFYTMGGLMERWDQNPFGPISYRLAGRAELIHSNPTDSDNILHPSHGCIRLDREDVKVLEKYIGTGVSKIKISSANGESWRSAS